MKEDRQLIQMAAASATLEETAASLRTSIETIERKAERLGIKLKGKRHPPPSRAELDVTNRRAIRRLVELGA